VDFTQIKILTKDKTKEKFHLLFVLDGCFSVAKNEQISDIDTVKTIELALLL
jgi:hypothetical protein